MSLLRVHETLRQSFWQWFSIFPNFIFKKSKTQTSNAVTRRFSPLILLTMTTGSTTHRIHPTAATQDITAFFHIVLKLRYNVTAFRTRITNCRHHRGRLQQATRAASILRRVSNGIFLFYPVTVVLHEIAEYTQDLSRSFCFLLISVLYTIFLLRIRIKAVIVVAKAPRWFHVVPIHYPKQDFNDYPRT